MGVSVVNPGFVDTPLTRQNNFTMPALLTPEPRRQAMLRGWERGDFEPLSAPLHPVAEAAARAHAAGRFPLVHRMTGL